MDKAVQGQPAVTVLRDALEVEVQEDGPGLRLTRADYRHFDLSGYPVRVNYMATLTHFTSSFH